MQALTISTKITMNCDQRPAQSQHQKGRHQGPDQQLGSQSGRLLGLLDFIVNAIIDGFENDITDQVVLTLGPDHSAVADRCAQDVGD
jgi:hypothetical protein